MIPTCVYIERNSLNAVLFGGGEKVFRSHPTEKMKHIFSRGLKQFLDN
jgi:hypothetical protein